MKKAFYLIAVAVMTLCSANCMAQAHTQSRYYNGNTLDYTKPLSQYSDVYDDQYYGLRIGAAFASVTSDDPKLNGSGMKTGLNFGFVYGKQLTDQHPLFLETGVSFIEKGGTGKVDVPDEGNKKFTYNLYYLQVPFVAKYVYSVDDDFTIQPYFGGYLSLGVGGKIKDYGDRKSYSSFGSGKDQFQHFDGGLKIGCGFGYDLFYGEVGYELGLTNICHDDFDNSSNSAFTLTIGINY